MEPIQLSTESKIRHINVNEIFGPTIQGEGIHTGQLCGFLRLAGCNLSCSWCDTPYSWDWERFDRDKESHKMTAQQIADQIKAMNVKLLIITGGEPMLQQWSLTQIKELTGCRIDVESNGTRMPTADAEQAVDMFCISPKLGHAGDPERLRIVKPALRRYAELAAEGKAIFKFVAQSIDNFAEIDALLEDAGIPDDAVWIMPEGANAKDMLTTTYAIADAVIERGWNLSLRQHTIIWDTERAH
jgi:organic radical activating enzyme